MPLTDRHSAQNTIGSVLPKGRCAMHEAVTVLLPSLR